MHQPTRQEDTTGVVLCGGRGLRVGGADKPLLELAGAPLVDQVIARLLPQVSRLILSANRNIDAYATRGWPVVPDAHPDRGPLAGIAAAAASCATPWLLVVPGDTPKLPEDLLARLAAGLGDADAAYAHDGERGHYLHLVLRRDRACELASWLDAGGRAVRLWLAEIDAAAVPFPQHGGAFDNINRLPSGATAK